jgi:Type I phosphodiesterase / nucleotide pyrophosphatase
MSLGPHARNRALRLVRADDEWSIWPTKPCDNPAAHSPGQQPPTMHRAARVDVAGGVLLSVCVLIGHGCAKPHYVVAPAQHVPLAAATAIGITSHVLVVSIDGLRPDAIESFGASTLQRLIREGSYTLAASTIMPSKTLPSHTSMLTGIPPERHQVLWNTVVTADAELIELPTIFGVARARGFRTAAFFSKAKFQPLQQPGTLDYSQAPGGWFGRWTSRRTVSDVEKHLATFQPHLLFVHLADPDRAGHSAGWMSPAYGRAVVAADAGVGRLLTAADRAYGVGKYTVIVAADHGGHDFDHGSADATDVTIPWIAWGLGVRPGQLRDGLVRTMDTASTVLWLLGLEEPSDWSGTPVLDAFARSTHAGGGF